MGKGYKGNPVDCALLVARLVVGITFVMHGSQLMFGAYGGPGLAGVVKMMGPIGYLVAIGQFFGGLGLVFGVLSRFSAFWLIVIMIGAIVKVHWKSGFFLGGPGHTGPPGYEFNLALIGLLLVVLIAGPGRYALANYLPLGKWRSWLE